MLLVAIGVVVLYGAGRGRAVPAADGRRRGGANGRNLRNAAGIGFAVGLLGGFVGLILGSMRLPAMVKWVGMTPYAAVGTNAAVGVIVGIGGLRRAPAERDRLGDLRGGRSGRRAGRDSRRPG